jgi:MraZ protein
MFLGEYEYKIDDKGRFPIPPKFRGDFKEGIVFVPGADKCILAYNPSQWKKLAETLTTSNIPNAKMRKLNRALFATAFYVHPDGQGRIVLPYPLRKYADISDDVIVAGANTYLEIWDKKSWEQEKLDAQSQVWQIFESMAKH